jgi:hypothetical protein
MATKAWVVKQKRREALVKKLLGSEAWNLSGGPDSLRGGTTDAV